jgi:hypothetical protein
MTKKLLIGALLVSFFLVINLVLATERSATVPADANIGIVSSNCDCPSKDSTVYSSGSSNNGSPQQPLYLRENPCPPGCQWICYFKRTPNGQRKVCRCYCDYNY